MADITDDIKALRRAADTGLDWLTSPDQVRRVVDECERLQKDAARLDSGAILFRQRNETGEPTECLYVRVDLRAAIDAATEQEAREQ